MPSPYDDARQFGRDTAHEADKKADQARSAAGSFFNRGRDAAGDLKREGQKNTDKFRRHASDFLDSARHQADEALSSIDDAMKDAHFVLLPRVAVLGKFNGGVDAHTKDVNVSSNKRDGPADDLIAFGGLAVNKTFSDVHATFYLSDKAIKSVSNGEAPKDALIGAKKSLSENWDGAAMYDIGNNNAWIGARYRTLFGDLSQRELDLKASYLTKNKQAHMKAQVALDDNQKISATYTAGGDGDLLARYLFTAPSGEAVGFPLVPPNDPISFINGYSYAPNTATLGYSYRTEDLNLQGLYDFGRDSVRATAAYRFEGNIVKATYDVRDETAGLEFARGPFRAIALAKVNRDGVGNITTGITFERTFNI